MMGTGRFILVIAAVVAAVLAGAAAPAAAEGRVPLPVLAAGKGDKCVEPTDVMRRYHMEYLKHQRDDTVHGGIRGAKHSLVECIECHAVPDAAAGGARTVQPFCGQCHEYAAVTMDCFGCHTNKPADAKEGQAR